MNINWYPGHMTKSIRAIKQEVSLIDVVVYVLDSRAPLSCLNPDFDEITGKLPVVFILNKTDLGDKSEIETLKKYLEDRRCQNNKNSVILLNSTQSSAPKILLPVIRRAAADKLDKYKQKGINKSIRIMVIGVPNSGKSTLINSLCGFKKTVTGNTPGVTRGKQWVKIDDNSEILDTPGTLYPKITDQQAARRLAYIGSIRDAVVDSYELAICFIAEISKLYSKALITRYGISDFDSPLNVLTHVGKSRGFLLRAGEPDLERAATAVIDDFRKGRLGGITLDRITDTLESF